MAQDGIILDEDDSDDASDKNDIKVVDFDDTDDGDTPEGLRRTGDVLTLDYQEVEYMSNPFATRTVRINPFRITYWFGRLRDGLELTTGYQLRDSRSENADLYGDFRAQRLLIGIGAQMGYNEIIWGSWLDELIGRRRRFGRRIRTIGGRKGYRRRVPKWWNERRGNIGRIARKEFVEHAREQSSELESQHSVPERASVVLLLEILAILRISIWHQGQVRDTFGAGTSV